MAGQMSECWEARHEVVDQKVDYGPVQSFDSHRLVTWGIVVL